MQYPQPPLFILDIGTRTKRAPYNCETAHGYAPMVLVHPIRIRHILRTLRRPLLHSYPPSETRSAFNRESQICKMPSCPDVYRQLHALSQLTALMFSSLMELVPTRRSLQGSPSNYRSTELPLVLKPDVSDKLVPS